LFGESEKIFCFLVLLFEISPIKRIDKEEDFLNREGNG
jgi:hypothetical protein